MTATTHTDALISAARGYIGTRFHHQGRVPGIGLDCVGVIVCAAKEAGYPLRDFTAYPRCPDGKSLVESIAAQMDHVPVAQIRPGDVLTFWIVSPGLPQHVAIYTGAGILHAYAGARKVVEHGFSATWRARVHSAWRLRDG